MSDPFTQLASTISRLGLDLSTNAQEAVTLHFMTIEALGSASRSTRNQAEIECQESFASTLEIIFEELAPKRKALPAGE